MYEIFPKTNASSDSVKIDENPLTLNQARQLCDSKRQCKGYAKVGNVYYLYSSIPDTEYSSGEDVLYVKKSNNTLLFVMGTLFVILLVLLYWMANY